MEGIASLKFVADCRHAQLTDIEQETGSLLNYDRKLKMDPAEIARIHDNIFHGECVNLLGLLAGQSSNRIPEVLGAEKLDANFMNAGRQFLLPHDSRFFRFSRIRPKNLQNIAIFNRVLASCSRTMAVYIHRVGVFHP